MKKFYLFVVISIIVFLLVIISIFVFNRINQRNLQNELDYALSTEGLSANNDFKDMNTSELEYSKDDSVTDSISEIDDLIKDLNATSDFGDFGDLGY